MTRSFKKKAITVLDSNRDEFFWGKERSRVNRLIHNEQYEEAELLDINLQGWKEYIDSTNDIKMCNTNNCPFIMRDHNYYYRITYCPYLFKQKPYKECDYTYDGKCEKSVLRK